MWYVIISEDNGEKWATVHKAIDGTDILGFGFNLRTTKHILPFSTKKDAKFVADGFNKRNR